MITNTPENKAMFFALHINGHFENINVFGDIHKYTPDDIVKNFLYHRVKPYSVETSHVLLTPLSHITDEHKYGVGILVNCWSWTERREDFFKDDDMKDIHIAAGKMFSEAIGKEWGPGLSHPFASNSTDILSAYDYLRSKGYALPYMSWSVDELVAEGVFKLKQ